MTASYQIQVKDGAGAIISLAEMGQGSFTRQTDSSILTATCQASFSATLPPSSIVTYVLVDVGRATKVHDTHTTDGPAPSLSVIETFCPECGPLATR